MAPTLADQIPRAAAAYSRASRAFKEAGHDKHLGVISPAEYTDVATDLLEAAQSYSVLLTDGTARPAVAEVERIVARILGVSA